MQLLFVVFRLMYEWTFFCRIFMQERSHDDELLQPIEITALPLQQTAQPEEFNIGIFSATTFMGMIFVLVPVSLAVDMVYDREVKSNKHIHIPSTPI